MNNLKNTLIVSAALMLEWLEFGMYGYAGVYLSKTFFSNTSITEGYFYVFAIFAISYFMRPIGGVVISHFSDKYGRLKAIKSCVALMSIPLLIIAILPGYNTWGSVSCFILLIARMLQGFSLGGQITGALVLVSESALPEKRSFLISFAVSAQQLGVCLAGFMISLSSLFFSTQNFQSYGWRLGFILCFVTAIVSYKLLNQAVESVYFKSLERKRKILDYPLLSCLTKDYLGMIRVIILLAFAGVTYFMVSVYMMNHFIVINEIKQKYTPVSIIFMTTIATIPAIILPPFIGSLCDRIGRKPLLFLSTILISLSMPIFFYISNEHNLALFLIGITIMLLLNVIFMVSSQTYFTEIFPTKYRHSALALSCNIAQAFFAGITPILSLYLSHRFGNFAPSYYFYIIAIITFLTCFFLRETKKDNAFEII